ncbi:uncharacterized protein LOC111337475 isoform X1 [Stylophora pistillata]|uniref:TNFR-Cys domain-containing protein n=1 Tax=Stylophora pistillata TaxID=50429 RepID=A0A2B4RUR2_STYPI|nr:uncharacterized protein LOC111337475 isoform X1 [Stylophora pistillata]PFX19995.1 hypothetical protein AWC38_SpisGene15584 [Stylophora pistillata]
MSMRSWTRHSGAKMKRLLIVFNFGMLICCVRGDFPCKSHQIHWNGTTQKKFKCIDCPDCPVGSEISVPCGTSVKYWTPVHCISCKLGETYSEKYDKAQCKACTICSAGKAMVKNCTLFSNTQCSKECKPGFYSFPFSFSCWPCSDCCHDGKDELSEECSGNYLKKCKMRPSPCSYVRTTNTPTQAATMIHRAPTQLSSKRNTQTPTPTKEKEKFTSPALSTNSDEALKSRINQSISTSKSVESPKKESGNKVLLVLSGVGGVLGIAGLFVVITAMIRHGVFCRPFCLRGGNSKNSVDIPLDELEMKPTLSQEELRPDDVTLEELERNSMDLFDWVCTRLDNGRLGFRRDYERLAAKYRLFSLDFRNSLKNELKIDGGSPSKVLMSQLQTMYPNHPVRCLVRKLKEIRRNDIAQKLTPYALKNVKN